VVLLNVYTFQSIVMLKTLLASSTRRDVVGFVVACQSAGFDCANAPSLFLRWVYTSVTSKPRYARDRDPGVRVWPTMIMLDYEWCRVSPCCHWRRYRQGDASLSRASWTSASVIMRELTRRGLASVPHHGRSTRDRGLLSQYVVSAALLQTFDPVHIP
jgi:hypothetical protein